ncbi:MAG: zinc ABC transporter substrate-binding protein [Candidatus Dormiibacterota bacterium]
MPRPFVLRPTSWVRARPALAALVALVFAAVLLVGACGSAAGDASGRIVAVGAENEYANVIAQVGGRYVQATAIMSNPNTDPHSFEASPKVAQTVGAARLVVQNGLGYDDFMTKIENASKTSGRRVISVQSLLGLSNRTPNPHLWYQPNTMPKVARAIGEALATADPSHASYFRANVATFDRSLEPWKQAVANLRASFPGAPVAVTEPVADYLVSAAGLTNRTPWALQADVMNGVDLSPQDVSAQQTLLRQHQVRALLYNEQVTDSVTQAFLQVARESGVPVVAVYETMPTGYSYQSWMLAQTKALQQALATGASTVRL